MAERDLAVVIGAGALGTVVARQLAQRHPVLLADLDFDRAETQSAALRSDGAEVMAVGCDVTNAESVDRLATLVKDHGGMRVLVHVAGLAPAMGAFDAITLVNLVGLTLFTEALLPCANPGAAAIMISSLGAHLNTFPEEVVDILRQYAGALDLPERLRGGDRRCAGDSERCVPIVQVWTVDAVPTSGRALGRTARLHRLAVARYDRNANGGARVRYQPSQAAHVQNVADEARRDDDRNSRGHRFSGVRQSLVHHRNRHIGRWRIEWCNVGCAVRWTAGCASALYMTDAPQRNCSALSCRGLIRRQRWLRPEVGG
jgi:NAD(P)-dependent dehydrogenase (short-subunit alcohol dehydrogenase family)